MRRATKPVMVTVDELPDEEAALHFAAQEAVLQQRPLSLVHVLHGDGRHSTTRPEEETAEAARVLVAAAARRVEALARGKVEITVQTPRGPVLDVLATLAGGAHLVVVRHRHVSKVSTILTPSTGARLAGRSTSPVVSVPPPWASLDRKVARVVLGVHDIPGSLPLVQEALSLADLHEVDLLVVHALGLPLPTAIDDPGTERLLPVWHEEATVQLDTILRLAWRGFPRVDVRSTVVDGKPAQALAAVTSVDDLLVLGRQRAAHADHGRLGKVGRALIARGTCPVLFVPGPPTPHATAREPAHAQR